MTYWTDNAAAEKKIEALAAEAERRAQEIALRAIRNTTQEEQCELRLEALQADARAVGLREALRVLAGHRMPADDPEPLEALEPYTPGKQRARFTDLAVAMGRAVLDAGRPLAAEEIARRLNRPPQAIRSAITKANKRGDGFRPGEDAESDVWDLGPELAKELV